MKHCPECNFTFPDFHRVCDFDGTELVPDPERPALVNAGPRRSRFWRSLKSPVLWAGLLLAALLSTAFLVAYWDATGQSTRFVKTQPAPASPDIPAPVAQAPSQTSPVSDKSGAPSTKTRNLNRDPGSSPTSTRPAKSARGVARLHRTSNPSSSQKSEVARQPNSNEKQPKLVAVLRTTWRVLKKPFKF